jgi:hypothetical protein
MQEWLSGQVSECPWVAQPEAGHEPDWTSLERPENSCAPMLPIQPDRAWEDLQRTMGETPQIQVCKDCSVIQKKTRGCNRCQMCFKKVLSKGSKYLCKCDIPFFKIRNTFATKCGKRYGVWILSECTVYPMCLYAECTKHWEHFPNIELQLFYSQNSLSLSGHWTLQGVKSIPQGWWPMLTTMLLTVVSSWLDVL